MIEARRRARASRYAWLLLPVAVLAPMQAARESGRDGRSLDALVDSIVDADALARGVPAVAIAIVADGVVVLQRAWGTADVETGRAATAATPFNIASVTKPFASALVLELVAEGKLALDDPVRRHLDWLPERYREITVRQLLTHTSGIARDLRRDNADDPDAATYRARLDTAAASAPAGQRYEYSNAGYTVLGWLVEAVDQRPLDEVLRPRIFEPVGMAHARYRAPLEADPLRARPHGVSDAGAQPIGYVTGGFASGGMSMSAVDAAAFGVALQSGRFLSGSAAATAWSAASLADGEPVSLSMFNEPASYGFGWFLTRYAGRRMMTHGGGIEGYTANLYHFPDDRLTIVVLANAKARDDGVAPVDPLARRIADICLAMDGCRLDPADAMLRAEITSANRAFSLAYLAGDTAAIRGMYAADAHAVPPNGRIVAGSASISRLFAAPTRNRRVHHALYTERLTRHDSGAIETGTWYDRWENGTTGAIGESTGRYALSWIREGGEWRIALDTWVPAERR